MSLPGESCMKPAALAATRHALLARLRMVTAIATGAATKIGVRAVIGLDIRTLRDAMLAIAIAALVMVREMAGALTATPGISLRRIFRRLLLRVHRRWPLRLRLLRWSPVI